MVLAEVLAEVDAECRQQSIPMLGAHKAARLVELVKESHPRLIVEIGTALGYSALWLAGALRELGQGHLVTIEQDPERAQRAQRNFERAGVGAWIDSLVGDARELVGTVAGPINFLFLDGGFENYYPCLIRARDRLGDRAVVVADNAGIGAMEMADYLDFVRRHYLSHTEWFDTDLPWNPRDAMEISFCQAPR